jgi:hypothetical protein
VEDRILVLNVLRGLSDRYAHLRTWITRQRPFPTFLEVRDDLVMEELTQGLQPGSTASTGSSSSSTALAATSPRPSAPPRSTATPPSSLLGPPPSGPSGGGRGGRGSRRRRGGGRGGGRGVTSRLWNRLGHGLLSRTRGPVASPCGPTTPPEPTLAHQWPCSQELFLLVFHLASSLLRRGFHPPGLHRGSLAGTRRLWLARSAPWA